MKKKRKEDGKRRTEVSEGRIAGEAGLEPARWHWTHLTRWGRVGD